MAFVSNLNTRHMACNILVRHKQKKENRLRKTELLSEKNKLRLTKIDKQYSKKIKNKNRYEKTKLKI